MEGNRAMGLASQTADIGGRSPRYLSCREECSVREKVLERGVVWGFEGRGHRRQQDGAEQRGGRDAHRLLGPRKGPGNVS